MRGTLSSSRVGTQAAVRPIGLPSMKPCRALRQAARRTPGAAAAVLPRPMLRAPGGGASRRAPLVCRASGPGVAHPGEEAHKERSEAGGGSSSSGAAAGPFNASFMAVPAVTMAKGGGGGGSGNMGAGSSMSMTMERSKLQFVMPTPPQSAPKLDDGGSGGDSGKNNRNGGGGGDGDGGDDDDYFGGEGEGDGDGSGGGGGAGRDGFFRTAVPELYDRLTLQAVLAEWYRTVAELPLFIRRAVEMGLFSSAQLVRFLSMDVRPNMARAVSRALPSEWARGFVGRLMADPAFVHKLVFEQVAAFGASMYHEYRVRGESFKQELDLAVINSLGLAAAVGATVWVTAPSRAYGAVHKFPWQQMLSSLPHCVFDASGPLRQYSHTARLGGFFASMAQLSAIGAFAGGATALASAGAVKLHEALDPAYEGPSVPLADGARSSAGLGAFFALNANTRYQLLGGMDRYLFGHTNFLWTYVGTTLFARGLFTAAGEASRPWWQGLTTDTAASHVAAAKKVKRVRRKVNKSGTVASGPALTGAERQAHLAAAAAAAAAASGSEAGGVSSALADYQPIGAAAAAAAGGAVSSSSSGAEAAAAAALSAYQPVSAADSLEVADDHAQQVAALRGLGSLEAAAHEQLQSVPAVMGGHSALEDLIAQQRQPVEAHQQQLGQQQLGQQQLHHMPSLSDSAIGAALRDAVGEAVGASA